VDVFICSFRAVPVDITSLLQNKHSVHNTFIQQLNFISIITLKYIYLEQCICCVFCFIDSHEQFSFPQMLSSCVYLYIMQQR